MSNFKLRGVCCCFQLENLHMSNCVYYDDEKKMWRTSDFVEMLVSPEKPLQESESESDASSESVKRLVGQSVRRSKGWIMKRASCAQASVHLANSKVRILSSINWWFQNGAPQLLRPRTWFSTEIDVVGPALKTNSSLTPPFHTSHNVIMIEWLWNFRDAHAAPNKTQILVKHVSSSAVVEPPAPKNKKNTSTLLHWGVLSQQPMNTHTHTPCFNLFWKNIVHATLKQIWGMLSQQPINAHTHTLFQFVFNKCCYGNFKTNLRDAVTATHKCTHTHTPCFNLFSTNQMLLRQL